MFTLTLRRSNRLTYFPNRAPCLVGRRTLSSSVSNPGGRPAESNSAAELLEPSKLPELPSEPLDRISFLPFLFSESRARQLITKLHGDKTPAEFELFASFVPMWMSWALYFCTQKCIPIVENLHDHWYGFQECILALPGFPSPAYPGLPFSSTLELPRDPMQHRRVASRDSLAALKLPACLTPQPFPPFALPPPDLDAIFRSESFAAKTTAQHDKHRFTDYSLQLQTFRTPFITHSYATYAPVFVAVEPPASSGGARRPFALVNAALPNGRVISARVPNKRPHWMEPDEKMPLVDLDDALDEHRTRAMEEFGTSRWGDHEGIPEMQDFGGKYWAKSGPFRALRLVRSFAAPLPQPEEVSVFLGLSPTDTTERSDDVSSRLFGRSTRIASGADVARRLGEAFSQRTETTSVNWRSDTIRSLWAYSEPQAQLPDGDGALSSPTYDPAYDQVVNYILTRLTQLHDPGLPSWMVDVQKARERAVTANLSSRRLSTPGAAKLPKPPSSNAKPKKASRPFPLPSPKPNLRRTSPPSSAKRPPTPVPPPKPVRAPPLRDHEGAYALLGLETQAAAGKVTDEDVKRAWDGRKTAFLQVLRTKGREASEELQRSVNAALGKVQNEKLRSIYEAEGKLAAVHTPPRRR